MTNAPAEEIEQRLVTEFGYAEVPARLTAKNITALAGPVADAFAHWWRTGEVRDLDVEGYSVARLQRDFGMNPIAAYLNLDFLRRQPVRARAALRRGIDSVGPPRTQARPAGPA